MKVAIVAYSFGGTPDRPGPSNAALGKVVDRIAAREKDILVIVQDFLKSCIGRKADLVVGDVYTFVNTEGITDLAAAFLKERDIRKVLLVAHPFLHWVKCKRLLEAHGFEVERARTGYVPFDPACHNWWVRSPLHLISYAFLQKTMGRSGR